jgi:hypothetical protein
MKRLLTTLALFALLGQDVEKARTLLQQALTALQPPAVVLPTPEAFDVAYAAAPAGSVLTLSRALVYPKPLVITKSIILQAETLPSPPARMDLTALLPSFRDGITITADSVSLIALEVRKIDPLTDIVVITGGAHVTLDRMRILGDAAKGAKRGIRANGNGDGTIIRSWVDECFQAWPGNDSQAIIAWDMAPGLTIEDNFLRGGSETIMIGGADASAPDRMPSGIIIRGNTITKRPEWQRLPIGVKNLLELKAARNVLIENNDLSYVWGGHGQDGYAFLVTPRNQDGRAPWSTVANVVFRGNRVSHAAAAINILGLDNIRETKAGMPTAIGTVRPSVRASDLSITGNTFTDLDSGVYGGSNRMILIGAGPINVTIDMNTFAGAHIGSQLYFYGAPPSAGLVVTGNTWPAAVYGIKGDGAASGGASWAAFVTGGKLEGNIVR